MTTTSSGLILRPIFIGNDNEILTLDTSSLDIEPELAYSKSGWMDSDLMIIWLKKIVIPFVQRRKCLLILDSFRAHASKDFEEEIVKYDFMQVVFVPGGLTSILQPNDLILNRMFKAKVRSYWYDRLVETKTKILQDKSFENKDTPPTSEE